MSPHSISSSLVSDLGLPAPLEKELPVVPIHVRLIATLRYKCKALVRRWWAWEFLAAGLSILATIALIAVLITNDGRTQDSFQLGALPISLNVVVAAISTVIRASLLVTVAGALNQSSWNWFSSPSKGAIPSPGRPLKDIDTFGDAAFDSWSSLRLLHRTKGKTLASLGAVITIASLAFDTFSQQVLNTSTRAVPIVISKGHRLGKSALVRSVAYVGQSGPSIQGAVMSSIFDQYSTLDSGHCATGECHWPTTPTLAMCSSCTDVKSQARVVRSDLGGGSFSIDVVPQLQPSPHDSESRSQSHSAANISFFVDLDRSNGSAKYGPISPTFALSSTYFEATEEGRPIIAKINICGVPPSGLNPPQSTHGSEQNFQIADFDNSIVFYQCEFKFCLQAYTAHTTIARIKQDLVATWDQWSLSDDDDDDDDDAGNSSWVVADAPAKMNINNSSSYRVKTVALQSLTTIFNNLLEDQLEAEVNANTISALLRAGAITNASASGAFAEVFRNAANSTADINTLATKMATGFTNFIRTSMSAPPDPRYGPTFYTDKTFIRVRWEWLTFPIGLLLAGHIFLLATVWQTQHRRLRPWKGHRVPLLLANIDDIIRYRARGGFETRQGLEERVGRIKVRLDFEGRDEIAFRRV